MGRAITIDLKATFRKSDVSKTTNELWTQFYSIVAEEQLRIDEAIWLFSSWPGWYGVRTGSPDDNPYEQSAFVLSADVSGIHEAAWNARQTGDTHEEQDANGARVLDEYESWLSASIVKSWQSAKIQKLHSKLVLPWGQFGIFSTWEIDSAVVPVSDMTWLAGDDISKFVRAPKSFPKRKIRVKRKKKLQE